MNTAATVVVVVRSGSKVDAPPPGCVLLVGADGQYLRGADGKLLYGVAQ